jgi:hypothetical protein
VNVPYLEAKFEVEVRCDCNKNRAVVSSGMLRRVALVRTYVSEELCASLYLYPYIDRYFFAAYVGC